MGIRELIRRIACQCHGEVSARQSDRIMNRVIQMVVDLLVRIGGGAPELPSPPNMIKWVDIELVDNGETCELVIKRLPKPVIIQSCDFDTNSQDGYFDIGHSSVYVLNREFIAKWAVIGSIISYGVMVDGKPVGRLHQIVETGYDVLGWYCYTRGLNVAFNDPWKIRLADIVGIQLIPLWTEFERGKFIYLG